MGGLEVPRKEAGIHFLLGISVMTERAVERVRQEAGRDGRMGDWIRGQEGAVLPPGQSGNCFLRLADLLENSG